MTATKNIVAYYRVSTKAQGDSGLGLDAQREYVRIAAEAKGWAIVAEFADTASGTIPPAERIQCKAALAACKEHNATLVVAKLDRLSRSVADISALMERIEFKVATMPDADSFQLHLYAALAQQERAFIAQRTKAALAALKAKAEAGDEVAQAKVARRDAGRAMGSHKGLQASIDVKQAKAQSDAQRLRNDLKAAWMDGAKTLRAMADWLNADGKLTAQGSAFTAMTVKRTIDRLGLTFP